MTQTPVNTTSSPSAAKSASASSSSAMAAHYAAVRRASMSLRKPLSDEDCQTQSMPEASPAKWHLAHTTWFFEQFVLARFVRVYTPHHPQFAYLFNSYYNAIGPRQVRPQRGLITRPAMAEVEAYRAAVDTQMMELIRETGSNSGDVQALHELIELGLHHEQQHQELLLTDIKHLLWCNPLRPAYLAEGHSVTHAKPSRITARGHNGDSMTDHTSNDAQWIAFDEGVRWIGHDGSGFAYDNEGPRHRVFLDAFEIASRPVTNGEYLAFMQSGGYEQSQWWLDEGWVTAQREGWRAPMYWEPDDTARDDRSGPAATWRHFTLSGMRDITLNEPVCHVSFFEADAFARWSSARLAREAEWETACAHEQLRPSDGNFVERGIFHPQAGDGAKFMQAFGDVWEWTGSPYIAYPGYAPAAGALGEYNGKWMCNQWVLRGGSCATPASHIRATYRNFFSAAARWQFSGIRLARDVR